jgi:hypothetical protein
LGQCGDGWHCSGNETIRIVSEVIFIFGFIRAALSGCWRWRMFVRLSLTLGVHLEKVSPFQTISFLPEISSTVRCLHQQSNGGRDGFPGARDVWLF